jgi:hypothetical protein
MKFLAYQDKRSPLCPSCLECKETCRHIVHCAEEGCAAAFSQSTQQIERWMEANHTHPDLLLLLFNYLRGRGSITCLKCSDNLNLPTIFQDYAASQDIIGWDRFVTGMVSSKLLPIQSAALYSCESSPNTVRWITGLITQLLQVTQTQWIYRCVLVHNRTADTLILVHKEDLLKGVKNQLAIGSEGLDEQDRFLLECSFEEMATTTGEDQEYWLLAIQAAREASRIHRAKADTEQQRAVGMGRRRAIS